MDLGDAISVLETFVRILATFDGSQPGYYAVKFNITNLGELTNLYVFVLVTWLISSYDAI